MGIGRPAPFLLLGCVILLSALHVAILNRPFLREFSLFAMVGTTRSSTKSPFAYAFVIGGCNPEKPSYKGYIYDIIVSARILHEEGSKADTVAFFQIDYSYPLEERPEEDLRLLNALDVNVRYIPKDKRQNFLELMLEKFRILNMTEYRRVLLMDGDVMPLGNLDYLFELSDGPNATLKENMVVTGPLEPGNGGFFMLEPRHGALEEMRAIIRRRDIRANSLNVTGLKFDELEGWGHVIEPPDCWETKKTKGTNWTFHGAFVDQGLLYHWVKYVKKSTSIINGDKVNNWSALPNGTAYLEKTLYKPFEKYSKPRLVHREGCNKFLCDFAHFHRQEQTLDERPAKRLEQRHKAQLRHARVVLHPFSVE
jgi:hypothetical protein